MSWAVGYDANWHRDIGYGVPAICDQPGCGEPIDRGLGYVCGGKAYGGEHGCGLYFCGAHLTGVIEHHGGGWAHVCERCDVGLPPFEPTPDTAEWMRHKLTDESWERWRSENPDEVERIRVLVTS
jgi:hypothetical protein